MAEVSSNAESLREAYVASLDWWREAGVLEHVEDEPGSWLRTRQAEAEAPVAPAEKGATASPATTAVPARQQGALSRFLEQASDSAHPGDPAQWPGDLAAFQKWWMESEMLDPPGAYPCVPPRGAAGASAMLILDKPQEDDRDALLQGRAGTLATNMLRAMGVADDAAYVASVLPRHTLRPDWRAIASAGYGKLLLHHIGLVAPDRLIVCGERVWSLLAHETAQDPRALTTIETAAGKVATFAMPDVPTLLRDPAKRAQTWTRWLDWNHSSS